VRLIFETHATSLDNEAGLASGHFDVDLGPRGEQQAGELGRRYDPPALARVACSDLRRSWRTAEVAFGAKAAIHRDARLRECDYGRLTRAPALDVEARRLRHVAVPFPGGEGYQQVVARVAAWLGDLPKTAGDRPVLVIGHRATWYALEHLLRGRHLAEVVASPWVWQPGWWFEVTGGTRPGPAGRESD